ncbi:MAG: nucleotidyltransferase [Calditrichaeota bacterium]|nr:nucleotidyltransferase [Calditrichota bacterium]
MTAAGKIEIPEQQIAAFCRKWKITELALFGSVLGEDFRPESDVDVLVRFAPDHCWSLFDHVEMQEELKEIFGRDVDLVNRQAIERSHNPIRRKAILESAEVVHVFEG